jgi:DNA polymerase I-like protein with 3'-5' exonuclease and polymerase domains
MIPLRTTIDLETTVHNKGDDSVGKFQADPHHPDNFVVSAGYLSDGEYTGWYNTYDDPMLPWNFVGLLVGQNFKFDLLYFLLTVPQFRLHLAQENTIWDIQLAEYILTGQESTYANLNKMSEKYGGTQKKDIIKEYWDAGYETEDIPRHELEEYNEYDVRNTDLIFCAQYEQAEKNGMLPLIESQMEALLATTEMEFNGMCFDRELALNHAKPLAAELEPLAEELTAQMVSWMPMFHGPKVKPSSIDQVSLCLFGGEYPSRDHLQVTDLDGEPQFFKNGKPKMRYFKTKVPIKGLYKPRSRWKREAKPGFYQVTDEVVQEVKLLTDNSQVREFCEGIQRYRTLSKELNTYLLGYSALAWPDNGSWFLHGKYNHAKTATGRLSSSKPNCQNISGMKM